MADMIGLATLELAAEDGLKKPASAPVLKLGVLDTGFRLEADVLCCRFMSKLAVRDVERFAVLLRLSVRGGGGIISVFTRRAEIASGPLPELNGLGW
jgi:hypothetical protein